MAKRFEYKGPEIIKTCGDCLYLQFGSDEELHCNHPEKTGEEMEGNLPGWLGVPDQIPDWCPLEDK